MRISNITLPNTGLVLVLGDAGAGKSSRVSNALLLAAGKADLPVRVLTSEDLNLAGKNPAGFNVHELEAAAETSLIVFLAENLTHLPATFRAFFQEKCHAVFVLHCSAMEIRSWVSGHNYRIWGLLPRKLNDPISFPMAGASKMAVAAAFVRTLTGSSFYVEQDWDVAQMCSLPLVRDDQVVTFEERASFQPPVRMLNRGNCL